MNDTITPAVRTETRRVKILFELRKDLQDDEAICEHCHGTGLRIADNIYGIKGDTTQVAVRFPYKHQSLSFCTHCYNGVQKKCTHCGSLRGRSGTDCPCGHSRLERDERRRQSEAAQWEKARKISLAAAWETYYMLYIDNFDRYVLDEEELELAAEDCEVEISELRIYGTSKRKISISAGDVAETACEDLHEDAYDQCDVGHLQSLLDIWCAEQTGTDSYYPDFSVGVVVGVKDDA